MCILIQYFLCFDTKKQSEYKTLQVNDNWILSWERKESVLEMKFRPNECLLAISFVYYVL